MATFAAARSVLRSPTVRTAATKLSTPGANASGSSFRFIKQKRLSARIFRSPVELSGFSVETALPYHAATASALLTSMLSVSRRSYGWIPD
ncbi:hypothetical protein RJ641_018354, partial [Dillenia turbinata]